MQKLIELLNEYRKEKGERSLNEFEVSQTLDSLNYLKLFIKWLVENEKIDFDNRDLKDKYMEYFERYPYYPYTDFSLTGLIMLLSIQDEPIEFLVSILK